MVVGIFKGNYDGSTGHCTSIHVGGNEAKRIRYVYSERGETTEEYKERCVAALQVLKVTIGPNVLENIDVGDIKKGDDVEDRFMAAYMLSNADRVRHGDRVSDLEKEYEVGQDNIPDKPSKAF